MTSYGKGDVIVVRNGRKGSKLAVVTRLTLVGEAGGVRDIRVQALNYAASIGKWNKRPAYVEPLRHATALDRIRVRQKDRASFEAKVVSLGRREGE